MWGVREFKQVMGILIAVFGFKEISMDVSDSIAEPVLVRNIIKLNSPPFLRMESIVESFPWVTSFLQKSGRSSYFPVTHSPTPSLCSVVMVKSHICNWYFRILSPHSLMAQGHEMWILFLSPSDKKSLPKTPKGAEEPKQNKISQIHLDKAKSPGWLQFSPHN